MQRLELILLRKTSQGTLRTILHVYTGKGKEQTAREDLFKYGKEYDPVLSDTEACLILQETERDEKDCIDGMGNFA